MAKIASNKRYQDYDYNTQCFMLAVERFLIEKYEQIQPHWLGQLQLLAGNYDAFVKAQKDITNDGVMITTPSGFKRPHPMLQVLKDSNNQCIKLIQEFGLSPNAFAKLDKRTPKNEVDEDELIIKQLING